jgi:hypothetical protein
VRFGTQGRKTWETGVSAHASQHETVKSQVTHIKDGDWQGYQNTVFKRLLQGGVIYEFLPGYYLEKGVLKEALEICKRELSDMKEIYGENHDLTADVKDNVIGILKMQGKWEVAEALVQEPRPMGGSGSAGGGSDGDSQDEARSRPSLDADQHGQPGIDVLEPRPMGSSGRAVCGSDGDSQDEARSRPSLDADQHGQPGIDVLEPRPMGSSGSAGGGSDGDSQDEARSRPS